MKGMHLNQRRWLAALILLPILAGLVMFINQPATAAPQPQTPDNSACLACHGQPGQTWKLPSGEVLGTTMDKAVFDASAHKKSDCKTCHTNISSYPHPKNTAQTIKEYRAQYKDTCATCHPALAQELMDSAHTALNKAGNTNTPICVDCHNAHTQASIKKDASGKPTYEEHATIAKTCATCHNAIYSQYVNSVHGAGVMAKNPDVPACDECHGIHSITDARSVQYRLGSPEMCAKCHTDEAKMKKYNLSTNVLTTYVADFHGTTVTLFEKLTPDQQTNKPVCYDCHGVHNISRVDDPKNGLEIKQNMLKACQNCHPDASTNFPDSWLSHYNPSPTKYALVYYVNLFYMILIPVVLGGMALFILTDIYRKIRTLGKPAHAEGKEK